MQRDHASTPHEVACDNQVILFKQHGSGGAIDPLPQL